VERKLQILWVDAESLDDDSLRTDAAKYAPLPPWAHSLTPSMPTHSPTHSLRHLPTYSPGSLPIRTRGRATLSRYEESWKLVKEADGILVPGGFGDRGVEGKIAAAKWARENKKPYLGICLGFQARRHACASSTRASSCPCIISTAVCAHLAARVRAAMT
jgi:hypothetical protein